MKIKLKFTKNLSTNEEKFTINFRDMFIFTINTLISDTDSIAKLHSLEKRVIAAYSEKSHHAQFIKAFVYAMLNKKNQLDWVIDNAKEKAAKLIKYLNAIGIDVDIMPHESIFSPMSEIPIKLFFEEVLDEDKPENGVKSYRFIFDDGALIGAHKIFYESSVE